MNAPLLTLRKGAKAQQAIVGPQRRKRRVAQAGEVGVQKADPDPMPAEPPRQGRQGVDAGEGTLRGPNGGRGRRAGAESAPGRRRENPRPRSGRPRRGQGSDRSGLPNEWKGRHSRPSRVGEARTHGMEPSAPDERTEPNRPQPIQVGGGHWACPTRLRRRGRRSRPVVEENPVFLSKDGTITRRGRGVGTREGPEKPRGQKQHGEPALCPVRKIVAVHPSPVFTRKAVRIRKDSTQNPSHRGANSPRAPSVRFGAPPRYHSSGIPVFRTSCGGEGMPSPHRAVHEGDIATSRRGSEITCTGSSCTRRRQRP